MVDFPVLIFNFSTTILDILRQWHHPATSRINTKKNSTKEILDYLKINNLFIHFTLFFFNSVTVEVKRTTKKIWYAKAYNKTNNRDNSCSTEQFAGEVF
jgi:hypothetical protein